MCGVMSNHSVLATTKKYSHPTEDAIRRHDIVIRPTRSQTDSGLHMSSLFRVIIEHDCSYHKQCGALEVRHPHRYVYSISQQYTQLNKFIQSSIKSSKVLLI